MIDPPLLDPHEIANVLGLPGIRWVMDDAAGVMNLSVAETTKALLVISQFTLYGNTTGGRRPSWIAAARP